MGEMGAGGDAGGTSHVLGRQHLLPSGSSPAATGAGAAGGVREPLRIPRSWIIYGRQQQLTVALFAICL